MTGFSKTITGILQPTIGKLNYKFKLITEDSYFFLETTAEIEELIERHAWEQVRIKGYLKEPHVLCVKNVRLENDITLSLQDLTKNFDLEHIRRTIHRGFFLEPAF